MEKSTRPIVTIVIVPRERFSYTQESLESILRHSGDVPYALVYVDGGSPAPVKSYLDRAAEEHDFTLVRTPFYLSPNRARNLGLDYVHTEYVLFCDNDVVVSPGWLSTLIECAEETGAAVVTPLTCEGTPLHEVIHCAGGEAGVVEQNEGGQTTRAIVEKMHLQKRHVADQKATLVRRETGLAEFHCMLVRNDMFAKVGKLDEGFLSSKEHIDFCMLVREAGETIVFEPSAIVTYIFNRPLSLSDYPYFMLRWSDAWEVKSLRRMMEKWRLEEDGYFVNRIKNRGWRRNLAIWGPLASKMSFGKRNRPLSRALFLLDRGLNYFVTRSHQRKQSRLGKNPLEVRLARRGNQYQA